MLQSILKLGFILLRVLQHDGIKYIGKSNCKLISFLKFVEYEYIILDLKSKESTKTLKDFK